MENLKANWEKVLSSIEKDMLPTPFNTWIKPLMPQSIDESRGVIELITYNDMSKSVLDNRYVMLLESVIKQVFGREYKVNFILSDDLNKSTDQQDIEKEKDYYENVMKRPGDDEIYLNPRYTFNTFVVGSNNELAYAAALAVAKSPATEYNPLFIYGDSGLGKTHLMHAIGHHVLQNNPYKKVLYVSSELFTTELVNAIQSKNTTEFRNKYRNVDLLMIDDIQFIEKKDRTQEELFHTFNTLYDSNKQIILSSLVLMDFL